MVCFQPAGENPLVMRRTSEASLVFVGFPRKKKPLNNGSYEHRVPKKKLKKNIILYEGYVCDSGMCVGFNIVIGHLGRPYSTHTAPTPVLTDSVHAHILTKPSCAGFAVIRLVDRARRGNVCLEDQACSPTDQPVRKFEDSLVRQYQRATR